MIHVEHRDDVAVVELDRGVTNALNLPLVNALSEALNAVQHDPQARGLVLTSANDKFFSIGFDIPHLFDLTREQFSLFYRAFNRLCLDLFTLPKPTAAAITGHAIAGGCILALCCDYRCIPEGRKLMGLNEIHLGVPVPYPAACILPQLVGFRYAREIVEYGEFYQPQRLLQIGLVDQVLPLAQVRPASIQRARTLGALPQAAFAIIKHNRVGPVAAQILARLEEREHSFVECWYSEIARERLQEAMEKF